MAEAKTTITISQLVDELVFDIQNKAYLTGQAREAEGKGFEAASNMQASNDDDNIYQILRSITKAFGTLKSQLGEYLNETETTSDNKIPTELEENDGKRGELKLAFLMPSNFNKASVDALGSNIHAYLVESALADWFVITNKTDADTYVAQSATTLDTIKRAIYRRSRPTRPTYTPATPATPPSSDSSDS